MSFTDYQRNLPTGCLPRDLDQPAREDHSPQSWCPVCRSFQPDAVHGGPSGQPCDACVEADFARFSPADCAPLSTRPAGNETDAARPAAPNPND